MGIVNPFVWRSVRIEENLGGIDQSRRCLGTKVNLPMAIGVALEDSQLTVVICTPAGRRVHLEVADNTEAAWLRGVIGQQAYIAILAIRARYALHAKQVGKHLCCRRGTISVFTIVSILNYHDAKRYGELINCKLL